MSLRIVLLLALAPVAAAHADDLVAIEEIVPAAPAAGAAANAPLVHALVEDRLLAADEDGALAAALRRWAADLAAEGFRAAVSRARLYRGPVHQDGRIVLALRERFRDRRAAAPAFAGVVLVGAFPEAFLVRTVNWRKRTPIRLRQGRGRRKAFPKPVRYLRTVPEAVAHTCDLVLSDLDGRWEDLYTRERTWLPATIAVFPDGVPAEGGVAGDWERSAHAFEDFFHVNDGHLRVIETTDEDGRPAGLFVDPLDEVRDAECSAADRGRPNVIAHPDIAVSRVNARGIARDAAEERRLLLEYFDRNHRYRTGELEPPFRPASLAHGLPSGYGVLKRASKEWAALADAELDVHGRPGRREIVEWLKRPAVLRTVRAHTNRHGSSFGGHTRLDRELLRGLWKDGAFGDGASFWIHTGCEAISPCGAERLPWSDPRHGHGNSAAALLFFADGLALVGRAKVFYDEPRGFVAALGAGETFGAAWRRYFEVESRGPRWRDVGGDIGRKRSYFWSLLGDWTLRLRRPGERAADWFPFAAGTRWTIEVRAGRRTTEIEARREGGDVRSLDGKDRVRFDFVYGRIEDMDHDVVKSIYAMPESGPREFYFDGWVFRLHHDPPIPLLPERPVAGAEWTWEGRLECGGAEADTRARLTVEGPEDVEVPAGTFRALRVRAVYESPRITITRWFARGVGLVRMEVEGAPEPVTVRLLAHEPPR